MRFKIDDSGVILNHIALEGDTTSIDAIISSDLWKNESVLEAEVTVNGVKVPAENFEKCLQHLYSNLGDQLRDRYDADKFDERVQQALEKHLEEKGEGISEAMDTLRNALEDAEDIVTPYWNKEPRQGRYSAVKFANSQFESGDKVELRQLLDFIYGSKPKNKTEEIECVILRK